MADLHVIEIFDSLQGEGFWTGVPMTFVRLAGCNAPQDGLACTRWCDSPESWDPGGGETLSVAEIMTRAHLPRLCLTGGEPLLQPEGVAALLLEAHRCGLRVHLETNGTMPPPRSPEPEKVVAGTSGVGDQEGAGFDWVVVSPKPPLYGVAPEWRGLIDELKLVVDERMPVSVAEGLAAANPGAIVSVQPMEDVAGAAGAKSWAVRLVMEHPDWRLSLQTHKYLGIR